MTEETNDVSTWFQDNLRIIISIGIVILLVFAIYSYSKRNSRTETIVDDSQIEEVALTQQEEDSAKINEIIDEIKDEEIQNDEAISIDKDIPSKAGVSNQEIVQEKEPSTEQTIVQEEKETESSVKEVVREIIESHSQQKEGVITVTAVRGDSITTLARKSAAKYITQNNITGLTPAHKIYIEDYMRKAKNHTSVYTGTNMEFSNALINEAIEKSKMLNDIQLRNLEKYAQNVSFI